MNFFKRPFKKGLKGCLKSHMRTGLLAVAALAAACGALGNSSLQGSVLAHERLRVKNTFKSPDEVVAYYCARDASGFVWSGLLESERQAFTTWPEVPEQDSFYIAKDYKISPVKRLGADHATVGVRYAVLAIADAHGTRMPVSKPELLVEYDLKKVGGQWKIVKPAAKEISPIVLESKFPVASAP
jgi:hypothetical protein